MPPLSALKLFDYLPTLFQFPNLPGIPLEFDGFLDSVKGLENRRNQRQPAIDGLIRTYTIDGNTKPAKDFLFGESPDRFRTGLSQLADSAAGGNSGMLLQMFLSNVLTMQPETSKLTQLSLDSVDQFSMTLTNFQDTFQDAQESLPSWEATLTDPESATKAFWPTLAEHALAYNFLFLEKIGTSVTARLKTIFGADWNPQWETHITSQRLYCIDLNIFTLYPAASVDKHLRFTPGTVTLLKQDPTTLELTPIAVRVADYNEANKRVFEFGQVSDSHWLYALSAAKTSATVCGIWLGHVYHWHIVTAAVLKGMMNQLPLSHGIAKLLRPQSDYLMQFNEILLLTWKFIAPPTSFDTSDSFLKLMNDFAVGRNFFDDDPEVTLKRNGIRREDFSFANDWDRYPIVPRFLRIYEICSEYVDVVVDTSYKTNQKVKDDQALGDWIKEARQKGKGNIKSLTRPTTKTGLKRLLTSLIYRVTMHGCSRMRSSLSPVLSWVGNYPVCLQRKDIPKPGEQINLLKYLPKTGTLGLMIRFYGIFIFSEPYESLLPVGGDDTDLYFSTNTQDPRNQALVRYRQNIRQFIGDLQATPVQPGQWPRGIET